MKLSILIPTVGRRNDKFVRLVESLTTQIKRPNQVEIIAYWNNGELSIGEYRQALLREALGEYVCFIDDDDTVPDYYVKEILKALGKDYVGFEVRLFNDGVEAKKVVHSLSHGIWHEDEHGYYRGVTHLNPIKRTIALQGTFSQNGAGEDAAWAKAVSSYTHTENYIDKVMYLYWHDNSDTHFGGDCRKHSKIYRRPAIKNKNFRYHPDSKRNNKEEVL